MRSLLHDLSPWNVHRMVQGFNLPGILGFFNAIRQPRLLIPSCSAQDISKIDFSAARKAGIKAVCFDKDNCLTLPYKYSIEPGLRDSLHACIEVFSKENVAILSNSAGSSDDAPGFREAYRLEQATGIPVIRHGLKKPACASFILRRFKNFRPEEIMYVGDRLLTDVLMANQAGLVSVHTQPLSECGDNVPAKLIRRVENAWLRGREPSNPKLQSLIIREH